MAIVCCITADAHFRIKSVAGGSEGFALKYLAQTDTSTLIYGTFTATIPEGSSTMLVNIPDSISVKTESGTFKMTDCRGMETIDTTCSAYKLIESQGQKINFVMEFEKFGCDAPFDIVCVGEAVLKFEFQGVAVNMEDTKEIDTERFLTSTKAVTWGKIEKENGTFYSYERDSVFVCVRLRDDGNYAMAQIQVKNDSDHGILINAGEISFKAVDGKGQSKDLKNVTKAQYDNLVASGNWAMADYKSGGTAVSIVGSTAAIVGFFLPRSIGAGLSAADAVMQGASVNMATKKLAEMEEAGETEKSDDYILTGPLKKGEETMGVILAKKHNGQKNLIFTITLDDYPFTFWLGSFPSDAAARY